MVSVIVPIYKVEAYLEKCIKSILQQSYNDLEIILVDDGSPDGCGTICDEYAKKDTRIKVIHKENGGLSDARNKGIDIATGEYFLFVDSDDYIHPRMIEKLLVDIQNADADMAVCRFREVSENEKIVFDEIEMQDAVEIFTGQDVMNNLQYKNLLTVVAWNKLYKAELFEGLRYPKGHIHEDEFIVHRVLRRCKKTVYSNAELYFYVQRTGSIMGEVKYSGVKDGWLAYEERLAFLKNNGYHEMVLFTKLQMMHYICKFYDKLEKYPEATEFLQSWLQYFKELFESTDVQSKLTDELLQEYNWFVINPKVYYNKKIKSERRATQKDAFKKMVRRILKK